jgi:hypothetical protein
MENQATVSETATIIPTNVHESKMTLFGRTRQALAEVGIDLSHIMRMHEYFVQQQAVDPEFKIPTYRAKIPSGGGRVFDIITGDEEFDVSVPKFEGVVANFHNCNALFSGSENMKEPPACSSEDGINGFNRFTGEITDCLECPHNQWGSSEKSDSRGKACKNMRRLYILAKDSDMPIVMTIPPTSINRWEKYKSAVLGVQLRSPQDVVTEFSLGHATNVQGKMYSVVQFRAVGAIGNEARLTVKALGSREPYPYDKSISQEDYERDQSTSNDINGSPDKK